MSARAESTAKSHLTPRQAIRCRCLECVCDEHSEIRNCTARTPVLSPVTHSDPAGCYLWPFRLGHGKDLSRGPVKDSALKAARKECLNCQGGSSQGVEECPSIHCALWRFRFGKNPSRQGNEANIRAWKFKAARTPADSTSAPTERLSAPERPEKCV